MVHFDAYGEDDLIEADARFNTADYDFTDNVTASRYKFLILFTKAHTCSTAARTLGEGDVVGLQSMY